MIVMPDLIRHPYHSVVMPDLIRHPLPLGRHAGLDPASTFFSNRGKRRWTPDQVRGDGGERWRGRRHDAKGASIDRLPHTIVMPDLIRHPPSSSPTATREGGPRIKSGVTAVRSDHGPCHYPCLHGITGALPPRPGSPAPGGAFLPRSSAGSNPRGGLASCQPGVAADQYQRSPGRGSIQVRLHRRPLLFRQAPNDLGHTAALP